MFLASEFKADQLKLVKMALIHDLGEAAIGDLVWERGRRVIGSQKQKHSDELKAIKYIFDSKNYQEYINLWQEFEEQKTLEARLLKQIDKLEMVIQTQEYEQEGSKNLEEFWQNAEKYLKDSELSEYFRDMKK